jgi:hypothetical protein
MELCRNVYFLHQRLLNSVQIIYKIYRVLTNIPSCVVQNLDDKNLSVVFVYGTNNGLAILDAIETSAEHLLSDTQWAPIAGGNHTQFDWYDTTPARRQFPGHWASPEKEVTIDSGMILWCTQKSLSGD